jgi:multiple sugar transport system substrate-binding protein
MVSTFTQLIPQYSKHKSEAKDFLIHLVGAAQFEVYNSELYNLPAYKSPQVAAELQNYYDNDPFQSDPPDKLKLCEDAADWSANIGYPGAANAAIAEVFGSAIIESMFRDVVQNTATPDQAVSKALNEMGPIFDKWRAEGLI